MPLGNEFECREGETRKGEKKVANEKYINLEEGRLCHPYRRKKGVFIKEREERRLKLLQRRKELGERLQTPHVFNFSSG